MRITCLQHVPFEGPGRIAAWARRRGHALALRQAWRSRFTDRPDAVVVLGGPMSVGDDSAFPWLAAEKRWLAAQIRRGVPALGICLGAQLLAEVLGGRVHPGEQPEIGWFPVTRAADCPPGPDALLPPRFTPLHWHGDTFDPPPGAVRLAESAVCRNQAFLWGNRVLGLQFHLEATPASARRLVGACADELAAGGDWVQGADTILADAAPWQAGHDLLEPLLDGLFAARLPAAA